MPKAKEDRKKKERVADVIAREYTINLHTRTHQMYAASCAGARTRGNALMRARRSLAAQRVQEARSPCRQGDQEVRQADDAH
jgi:hypothetical protein